MSVVAYPAGLAALYGALLLLSEAAPGAQGEVGGESEEWTDGNDADEGRREGVQRRLGVERGGRARRGRGGGSLGRTGGEWGRGWWWRKESGGERDGLVQFAEGQGEDDESPDTPASRQNPLLLPPPGTAALEVGAGVGAALTHSHSSRSAGGHGAAEHRAARIGPPRAPPRLHCLQGSEEHEHACTDTTSLDASVEARGTGPRQRHDGFEMALFRAP